MKGIFDHFRGILGVNEGSPRGKSCPLLTLEYAHGDKRVAIPHFLSIYHSFLQKNASRA